MEEKLREASIFTRHRRQFSEIPRRSSALFSSSDSFEDLTTIKPGRCNHASRPHKPPLHPLSSSLVQTILSPDNILLSTDYETVSTSSTSSCSETHTQCHHGHSIPHGSLWKGLMRMWRHKNPSVKRFSSFPPFGVGKLPGNKKLVKEGGMELKLQYSDSEQVELQGKLSLNWKNFSLDELKKATSDFSEGSKEKLNWEARFKVALGSAKGLEYLHERCPRRIIHRDIKAANILLTEDGEPQICDFGLAKWLPDKLTHHQVSIFEGTFGYIAPEYGMHGIVNEKSDIYAFGVILLELLSGRRAVDFSSKQSIVLWAKPLLDNDQITDLIDPSLGGVYDMDQVRHIICAAHLCVQHSPTLRPSMSQVLKILSGEETGPTKMKQVPTCRRTFSEEIFDAEEYNATRYLKDIKSTSN